MSSAQLHLGYMKLSLFVLGIAAFCNFTNAQSLTDAKVKSVFLVQFAQNIEWPNENSIDTFTIALLCNDLISLPEFNNIVLLKTIKNKPIKLVHIADYAFLSKPLPNLLYVDRYFSSDLNKVFEKIENNPTLVVSDGSRKRDLVMINFIYSNSNINKVSFEINSSRIESRYNFIIQPRLLLLGGTKIDVAELFLKQEETLKHEREILAAYRVEIKRQEEIIQQQKDEVESQLAELNFYKSEILAQRELITLHLQNLDSLKQEAQWQQAILLKNVQLLKHNQHETETQRKLLTAQNAEMEKRNQVLSKQEAEISEQQQRISAQKSILDEQSRQIQTQKGLLVISLSTILLAVGLIFFVYRNFRNKKKANRLLEYKNKEIEQQKEELFAQAQLLAETNQELEKLSIVASETDNGILIISPSGTVDWFNQGYSNLTGYTQLDFFDLNGEPIFNVEPYKNLKDKFEHCLSVGDSVTFESLFTIKSLEVLWLQITFTPIVDVDKKVSNVITVISNITELKKAHEATTRMLNEIVSQSNLISQQNKEITIKQQELEMAQKQIIQSEKMASIGVLTAGIAHEINNPVNFIYAGVNSIMRDFLDVNEVLKIIHSIDLNGQNSSELLKQIVEKKREYGFNEAYEAIHQTINDVLFGAQRVAEIVQGLRNFSRHENEALALSNVNKIIDGVLVLLKNKYKHHVEIVKNLDESLPSIECKAGKLNQVFMNIISNAIDAISDKGQIRISTYLLDNKIHISIKDNGSGIDEETLPKIFDPFFTTKEVGKGSGLGLSISYGIIEEHNGKIEVVSKVGFGTEFIVSIPAKQ